MGWEAQPSGRATRWAERYQIEPKGALFISGDAIAEAFDPGRDGLAS